MTTPTHDAICERLRNLLRDCGNADCNVCGAVHPAADLIQQQQADIERLSAEKTELEKQRLMLLAAVYKEAPRFVATICDEKLDGSGALLGQVRDLARAALGKDASDE